MQHDDANNDKRQFIGKKLFFIVTATGQVSWKISSFTPQFRGLQHAFPRLQTNVKL
jgi:hypothetical protein